ncbi:MAG: rRNA ((1)-)-methyltransferase [Paenibacillaceae bacterium]|nr:rRNA ((1)-)-methyltransferase [Paenibacillaceae bacterium]
MTAAIAEHSSLFACPICQGRMELAGGKSLICKRRHCFDVSRNGYVNLLLRPVKTKYSKSMFAARRTVISSGMYDQLHAKIGGMIAEAAGVSGHGRTTILDAGCGEGSHLQAVLRTIEPKLGSIGVGVDLAKEAIDLASRQYAESLWCVADLARLPFADRQFNAILNILSPSNYAEFQRVIAPDGVVVKVIPGESYLGELREAWYGRSDGSDPQDTPDANTEVLFREHFQLLGREHLEYRFPVSAELLEPLTVMTPLSWGAMEDRRQGITQLAIREITVDLIILVGR